MFKLSLVAFVFFLFQREAFTQLCSIAKANNTCICKRITNPEDNLVVSVADCSRIHLQNVPRPSEIGLDLNFLDLSHNEIKILENGFSITTLETLILSYNFINSISDGFLSQIPQLRKLILSHNNINSLDTQEVFKNNPKLEHLDLSYNSINRLQSSIFLPLKNLQTLDLSYNDLALGEYLSQRPDFLGAVLGLSVNISRLELDNVGIGPIDNLYFTNYTNLKYLSLADNRLTSIPSVPYSVEYLDLSGTDITTLEAKYLSYHSLKILKLNRMKKLESIHHYAFYNLQALEELYITDCWQLKEFNELVFGLLTKNETISLKKISLAKNGLQTLNSTYKYLFDKLEYVDVSDNPWKCNCNLLWMQEIAHHFAKKEFVKCSSPSYLRGKMVSEIIDEDLPSCFPEKYGKKSHRILISILILLVIMLSALVGYLIYYAPSWYGNRTFGIGPQSPYSPTRTEVN